MKKILFGITSLTLGGAERVLVDLANELSKDYEVTIWTLYGKGELEKQLNKNVKLKSYIDNSYNEISKLRTFLSFSINCLSPLLGCPPPNPTSIYSFNSAIFCLFFPKSTFLNLSS